MRIVIVIITIKSYRVRVTPNMIMLNRKIIYAIRMVKIVDDIYRVVRDRIEQYDDKIDEMDRVMIWVRLLDFTKKRICYCVFVISADLMQFRRVPPTTTQLLTSALDYLDLGHEADIDSVCSSISSSRVFFDESLRYPFPRHHNGRRSKSAQSFGYENEYENIAAARSSCNGYRVVPTGEQMSDMEIDYFDAEEDDDGVDPLTAMHKLTNDIRQNFGDYKLASFSDID